MKQLKIVQGTQSHSLQMKKLNTKFQYLSSSRYQDQKYLQYLQSLQKLNKQLISKLRGKDWEENLESLIRNIQLQNTYSLDALKQHQSLTVKLEKMGYKKKKEKAEMHEFYSRRIEELNSRIEELRGLMTDKEISFSKVLERLTMYEELHESKLDSKLDDFDFIINDNFVKKIISKISTDKHKLALDLRTQKKELNQYKAQCHKLKTALSSRMNYTRYKEEILQNSEAFDKTLESTAEIEVGNSEQTVRISPDVIGNAKNLVNLIKKQKIINDSLERQFKQVIQLNQDVINYNQLLTKSNSQKQEQLKQVKAKIDIIQKDMAKYQNHFHKNLRKSKSTERFDYKYLELIEDRPLATYLEMLKDEVEAIDLSDAMQERNPEIKAYSIGEVYDYEPEEFQNYFGEVEEL